MIKKIVLMTLAMIISIAVFAQKSNLKWHTDYEQANKEALATKKPIMFFFTGSDWCGWCIKMNKEVFVTPEFAAWAKKNVVLLEIDFPRNKKQEENIVKQNKQLQQMFGVQGYPTIHFAMPAKDAKTKIKHLGSAFYEPGGAPAFIKTANNFIKNK